QEEPKSDGEEREEFILQAAYCKDCERKLDLKDFSIKELRTI
ncbi:34937_t:CDS:1, partial [Racocetra persica]